MSEAPKNRKWFVVLSWVTLVGFALFVVGITASVLLVPKIRQASERGLR
jgi:hypothetical protein